MFNVGQHVKVISVEAYLAEEKWKDYGAYTGKVGTIINKVLRHDYPEGCGHLDHFEGDGGVPYYHYEVEFNGDNIPAKRRNPAFFRDKDITLAYPHEFEGTPWKQQIDPF